MVAPVRRFYARAPEGALRPAGYLLGLLVAASPLLAACDSVTDFRGEFRLSIVKGNFVRNCFGATTKATLSFDPSLATGDISTVPVADRNWLTTSDGTFMRTQLEPVRKLEDD